VRTSGTLSRYQARSPARWKLIRTDRIYHGWLDKEVGKLIEMAGRPSAPGLASTVPPTLQP
jgi:hypothetical protein